jgi:hypothetical protein
MESKVLHPTYQIREEYSIENSWYEYDYNSLKGAIVAL